MLPLVASVMSLVMGVAIVIFGQEKRVKLPFFLLCLSCAVLTAGHYVETTSERWTFLAARIVMTTALLTAVTGVISAAVMCGIKLYRWLWAVVVAAAAFNMVTVLFTDWYFDGGIMRYPWGHFVGGKIEFIANPLSVVGISSYGLAIMMVQYRRAHPLDRNRIGFIFLAFTLLSLTLFDYLPHFGIDLFGGLVSAVAIPLFLVTFGYAMLRYRLLEFRAFLGRAAGFALVGFLMVMVYFLVMEIARRLGMDALSAAPVAALLAVLVYAALGRLLPRLLENAARRREPDYQRTLEKFSAEMMRRLDEELLVDRTKRICVTEFLCSSAAMLDPGAMQGGDVLPRLALTEPVLETEIIRRQYGLGDAAVLSGELIVPLVHDGALIGAIGLGRRSDGRIFTRIAINGFRMLGNIVSMALVNTRTARELQKRHHLDRFLAPQVVERVLSGDMEKIESRVRTRVTVFFSDLKDFTGMSDRMHPEDLAVVLNEYLSEMAEVAFRFGGTVDKFIGDAVMVFFGAPVGADSTEQARQCVRMAGAMQRRLVELNRRWVEGGLVYRELSCRMGVHTGDAIVGSFGSQSRVDYTAIGSTVNLASRLEGACRLGMILVSAETRALLNDEFRVTPMGAVEVKGFSRPVQVFEVDPGIGRGDGI